MQIVTTKIDPTPDHTFTWAAFDWNDNVGPVGYGYSELEALADLVATLARYAVVDLRGQMLEGAE